MKNEFREAYINLFENSFTYLRRMIKIKLKAINYLNKYLLRNIKDDNLESLPVFGQIQETLL